MTQAACAVRSHVPQLLLQAEGIVKRYGANEVLKGVSVRARQGALKARDPAQLQRLRTQVAMVFQHCNLWAQMTALENVIEEGRTMAVVTHEMSFAREVSNHVVYLRKGQIEEEGAPAEVLTRPRSNRLRAFLANSLK